MLHDLSRRFKCCVSPRISHQNNSSVLVFLRLFKDVSIAPSYANRPSYSSIRGAQARKHTEEFIARGRGVSVGREGRTSE